MIHPTIPAELPGIERKSDWAAPSRVQVLNSTDITNHTSDARVTAGINVEAETNTETRGVDVTSDSVVNDNADQGMVPVDEDDELRELTPRYEDVDSNSDSDEEENIVHDEEFDEDSVGDEEPTVRSPVQRIGSGRVTRPPNRLIPTMTGKRHGNSRSQDEGVSFLLVGKYSDDKRDNIDC